jgi:uncharacterized protein YkvS
MTQTQQEVADMQSSDVLNAILAGACDDNIDAVYRAYKSRAKTLSQMKAATAMATLKVGDIVRFGQDTKPARLRGLKGRVVKFNPTRVSIEMLDNQWESYNVPPALLEKVEA